MDESAETEVGVPTAAQTQIEAPGRDLERLLRLLARERATDLHLKVGSAPLVRIGGVLRAIEAPPFGPGEVRALLEPVLVGARRQRLETRGDVDFAWSLEGLGRFRFNVFRQRGTVSAAIRRVETRIPDFESLRLPVPAMERLARLRRGLVLVCGATGSGKSTTLAALIGRINALRRCHIVTIEDPIEYLHTDAKAFINQREVGIDVPDFHTALRAVMRQDPDVILVGEMRDRETFEAALAAAETGHLVFSTLHSADVRSTIGRLVDLFPPERERQIRHALRFHLRAVICQKMLAAKDPAVRRVPAIELLLVNAEARKAIAEGEDDRLAVILRAGREQGMIDFNRSLLERVQAGLVEREAALAASPNPHQLEMHLKGIYLSEDRGSVR
ncbi:MAG: PilT/PilU family type 4a pilus ATPase [Planctomycetota bacterium]|nr:MAG: PilT/PilU family type 4a pilus ATPase [Planctomycetota bacterium]